MQIETNYEPHRYYNTANFPIYLGEEGNFHYYGNDNGRSAALAKAGLGCECSHFGDRGYFAQHVASGSSSYVEGGSFALTCKDWIQRR